MTIHRRSRRGRRTLAATTTTVVALVLLAGTAEAGVPDQQLHDVAEATYGDCGHITLWFDDHVDLRRPQVWNSTSGEVAGYTGLQFDWHCADIPQPELPQVTIKDTFTFNGRDVTYGVGLPRSADANVDSKDEGGLIDERSPHLTYNASEGYSSRNEYQYSGISAQGHNLSVVHDAVATLTWPDGNRRTLAVSDEARD